jgi:hypothetical protein
MYEGIQKSGMASRVQAVKISKLLS